MTTPGASGPRDIGWSSAGLGVDAVLGPGGLVARHLASSEARPEQLRMARAVAQVIAAGRHLMVEAGTGTGKSFASLVPAILAAAEQFGPVQRGFNEFGPAAHTPGHEAVERLNRETGATVEPPKLGPCWPYS